MRSRAFLFLPFVSMACGSASTDRSDAPPVDAGPPVDAAPIVDAKVGADAPHDSPPDANGPKRVFVSSTKFGAQLVPSGQSENGVDVADKACTSLAQAAGLGGTWRAYLSGAAGPNRRLVANEHIEDVGPWYLVDGTTRIFPNKESFNNVPLNPLDRDERGNAVPHGEKAWTGDSSELGTCFWWTTSTVADYGGECGYVGGAFDWGSSNASLTKCDQTAHLYCFEQ